MATIRIIGELDTFMIAAVTNFYNPSKRKIKTDNFNQFYRSLVGIPLYIVEAAFGDDVFILPESSNVMRVRCKDVIWQQYRLINLVINNLPDKFDKVVWIDADILFSNPFWHEEMDDKLDDFKVVQSYSEVKLNSQIGESQVKKSVTKVALENAKNPLNKDFCSCLDMSAVNATGFSWGVQRELVEKYGIYDYWITGSSDNAFVLGIWGDWENKFISERLNEQMKKHFMEWAGPFNKYVDGKVSYLNEKITHLWHGNRNYKKRWNCLKNFDPYNDVSIAENGVFEWSSEKADMHQCCKSMCYNYDVDFKPFL